MALRVLGLFSRDETVLGVTDIGRRLGINKSKASRLAAALAAEQFLWRTETGRYTLGHRLYTIGALVPSGRMVLDRMRPELYKLRIATGENVHLAVLCGTDVVHIERLHCDHMLKMLLESPDKPPAHAVSTGKILLAYADAETRETFLSSALRPCTRRTITNPDALRDDLSGIASRGFAIEHEEFSPGISSVAVPIFERGRAVAAMAVVAPTGHLPSAQLDRALRLLKDAAANARLAGNAS